MINIPENNHSISFYEPVSQPWDEMVVTGLSDPDDVDSPPPLPRSQAIQEIPISSIRPSPHQPRWLFDPDALASLAASIREHGVLQPIKVARHDDNGEITYELIFGERRWRAAKQAGLETIPAIVVLPNENNEVEWALQGLVENLHRADLNPMETLAGLKMLMALTHSSWSQLADLVGKSRRTIYYYRALDQMPGKIQELVASGQLTMKHINSLSAVENAGIQAQLVQTVIENDITGAALEEIVQSVKAGDSVQSAVTHVSSRRPKLQSKTEPPADAAGEGAAETEVSQIENLANKTFKWKMTSLHEAAMMGLTDQQCSDLSFEIRERELDAPDTRHAAAVMRQDPAKSAGAAVTYAQVLRNHPLYEPFKSLDSILCAILPLASADQPRAVRTVALAFLTEKEQELYAAIDALQTAEIHAR